MLKALGDQLKLLAADPKNHYASTVRQLTGPREAVRIGQPLRQMILAMPAMITQLRKWNEQSGLPPRSKRIQGFAMTYLYNPIEFLSSGTSGLFRYLDDAYLLARIYDMSLSDKDCAGLNNHSDDKALARNILGWVTLARELLPKETAAIDALLGEVAKGRMSSTKKRLPDPGNRKQTRNRQ